jgi:transposase
MLNTQKPLKKRYKYRIYPTAEQEIALSKVFGCVRYVYNRMLGEIKEARNMGSFAKEQMTKIKNQVGNKKVLCAVSGD